MLYQKPLLSQLVANAKKRCKVNGCGCKKAGLTCTDACICNEAQECENQSDYYCNDSSDDE